jgi:hypothetical protein
MDSIRFRDANRKQLEEMIAILDDLDISDVESVTRWIETGHNNFTYFELDPLGGWHFPNRHGRNGPWAGR